MDKQEHANINGITFYKSYYEACKEIPIEQREKIYAAIIEYAFTGASPELDGVLKALWIVIRPNIDNSIKKASAGSKGGKTPANVSEPKPSKKPEPKPEKPKKVVKPDPYQDIVDTIKKTLNKLYRRRSETEWSEKEVKALAPIKKRENILNELVLLKQLHDSSYQYCRKDIQTLLNNWTSEIDRANNPDSYIADGNSSNVAQPEWELPIDQIHPDMRN